MSVQRGTLLGPYEIVAPIGAGGMGEVWKARDTRLDRSVAVKILPAEIASNAQMKIRFEREAKTISQLEHPNICRLYDVGDSQSDGVSYLVMELLDGESLADRIARGPLPLPDVLRYGAEIAEALDRAHLAGVVHRDLKPGNIMITKSGAKLLDFGLAKSASHVIDVNDATVQKPLTQEGMILGTFQYMAPEQLEGEEADARTDIFALGAVLYEMATGKRAFAGKTKTSLIAAIVGGTPPPIADLQPLTPRALDHVIAKCIEKAPEKRWQSAHDVAEELRWIASEPETPKETRRSKVPIVAALVAGLIVGAAIARFVATTRKVPRPRLISFTIPSPPNANFSRTVSISPDGSRIIMVGFAADGSSMLYLRQIDSPTVKPLPGTEGALAAFWSPDGQHFAFVTRGKLQRMDLSDGSVHSIADASLLSGGASWNTKDVILFSDGPDEPLFRVPASGGQPVKVTHLRTNEHFQYWPFFLPDGNHFLFASLSWANGNQRGSGIYVGSLDSPEFKLIIPYDAYLDSISAIAYTAGHILYVRDHALMAQKFDPGRLSVQGTPVKVVDNIEIIGPGVSAFSVSNNGLLAYREPGAPFLMQLMRVDRAGKQMEAIGSPGPYRRIRVSPDGSRIALTRIGSDTSVWVIDRARSTVQRMTFGQFATDPTWLPDSRSFAYSASVNSPPNLYLQREGSREPERLTSESVLSYPRSVTSDGRTIIIDRIGQGKSDIYGVSTSPPYRSFPVVRTPFGESGGVVSPDDRRLAYTSNESGSPQIYVVSFPGGDQKTEVSNAGGRDARWSADGRHLFYYEPSTRRLMEVAFDSQGRIGLPRPLFSLEDDDYDVLSDGTFVIGKRSLNPDSPPVSVIVNWTNLLP